MHFSRVATRKSPALTAPLSDGTTISSFLLDHLAGFDRRTTGRVPNGANQSLKRRRRPIGSNSRLTVTRPWSFRYADGSYFFLRSLPRNRKPAAKPMPSVATDAGSGMPLGVGFMRSITSRNSRLWNSHIERGSGVCEQLNRIGPRIDRRNPHRDREFASATYANGKASSGHRLEGPALRPHFDAPSNELTRCAVEPEVISHGARGGSSSRVRHVPDCIDDATRRTNCAVCIEREPREPGVRHALRASSRPD